MPQVQQIEMVYNFKTGELLDVIDHGTVEVAEDPYVAYARRLLPELEEYLRNQDQPTESAAV